MTAADLRGQDLLEQALALVLNQYRAGTVMQLLWRGIAEYTNAHAVDLMFGCASLPGTDPDALAAPLSYLYCHHLAPPALRPRALAERYVDMRRLDPGDRLFLGDYPSLVLLEESIEVSPA